MTTLLQLNDVPHIMADGYVCDERRSLIFISLWGRDTAIQELLARLTLKNEDALTQLTLTDDALHEHLLFPDPSNLDKFSSRHPQTRFGTLVNLWLFDKRCRIPDRTNAQAFLLLQRDDPHWSKRIWALLKETTSLPLLDHWRDWILTLLQTSQMLIPVSGYGDLTGWQLALDTARLTTLIGESILAGKLTTIPHPADCSVNTLRAA
ncbi:hypothetical protein [Citrobacter portucalensis]|uniref:hypothetical protein n=1 Tax=Citrobacter portucalensis TaxID=1639133 RepID=UPI00226B7212|nr:hypothetical protein [Citrobacter portucalensis]MCX8984271.1 hypothetical protein [Citrobacter portucalensis]